MAVSVDELFCEFGLEYQGPFKWSEKLTAKFNGIYIISLTDDPKSKIAKKYSFEICQETFNSWILEAPELEISGTRIKDISHLKLYLEQFWKENENILYIGESSSITNPLEKRINQFYIHKVGQKGPHTGGFWLKLLSCLKDTSIFYAQAHNPRQIEFKMIMKHIEISAGKSFYELEDFTHYFPFANLKVDVLKVHSLKNHTNNNIRI